MVPRRKKKQTNVALCDGWKVDDKIYDLGKWMQRVNATFWVFGLLFRSCNIHFVHLYVFRFSLPRSLCSLPTLIAPTVPTSPIFFVQVKFCPPTCRFFLASLLSSKVVCLHKKINKKYRVLPDRSILQYLHVCDESRLDSFWTWPPCKTTSSVRGSTTTARRSFSSPPTLRATCVTCPSDRMYTRVYARFSFAGSEASTMWEGSWLTCCVVGSHSRSVFTANPNMHA